MVVDFEAPVVGKSLEGCSTFASGETFWN